MCVSIVHNHEKASLIAADVGTIVKNNEGVKESKSTGFRSKDITEYKKVISEQLHTSKLNFHNCLMCFRNNAAVDGH